MSKSINVGVCTNFVIKNGQRVRCRGNVKIKDGEKVSGVVLVATEEALGACDRCKKTYPLATESAPWNEFRPFGDI